MMIDKNLIILTVHNKNQNQNLNMEIIDDYFTNKEK